MTVRGQFLALLILPAFAGAQAVEELRGKVVTPAGNPVAQVEVVLLRQDSSVRPPKSTLQTSRTDASGGFRFALPKGNQERVTVLARVLGFAIGWANTYGPPKAPLVVRLRKAAPVAGKVVDPEGKPLPGARVSVQSLNFREWLALDANVGYLASPPESLPEFHTATDAQGRFRLDRLPEGAQVRLVTHHERYIPFEITDGWSGDGFRTGQTQVTLAVLPRTEVRGVVLREGKPVPGAKVWVRTQWGGEEAPAIECDEAGRFAGPSKPGRVLVSATIDGGRWRSSPIAFDALPGNDGVLSLTLEPATEIAGKVPAGLRMTAHTIVIVGMSGFWLNEPLEVEPDGKFRLWASPGRWQVRAWHEAEGYSMSSSEFEVAKGVPSQVLTLKRDGGGVRTPVAVQVVDARGRAVQGAMVLSSAFFGVEGSGKDGMMTLPSMGPGEQFHFVSPDRRSFGLVTMKAGQKSLKAVLRPGVVVTGKVAGAGGAPVAGAKVRAIVEAQSSNSRAVEWVVGMTDASGQYRVFLPRVRQARLGILHPGFGEHYTKEFALPAQGSMAISPITLKPATSAVEGVVLSDGGTPLAGTPVTAQWTKYSQGNTNWVSTASTNTDERGRFRISNVPPGLAVRLSVSHPFYESIQDASAKTGAKPTTLRLQPREARVTNQVTVGAELPALEGIVWSGGRAPEVGGKPLALVFASPYNPATESVLDEIKAVLAKHPESLTVAVVFDASVPLAELEGYAKERGLPFVIGRVAGGGGTGWQTKGFARFGVKSVPYGLLVGKDKVVKLVNPSVKMIEDALESSPGGLP